MTSFSSLDNVKGLLSLLDHYSLLKHLEGDSSSLETEGIVAVINSKGYGPAAKQLLDTINQDPQEQKAIIETLELKAVVGDSKAIKASHLWQTALNSPASREDLKAALKKADKVPGLRPKVKKALKDLLRILDAISNDKTFAKGERPGYAVYKNVFAHKGLGPSIKAVFDTLTENDKAELAKVFEIEGKVTPGALLKRPLAVPANDSDLKAAFCMIDVKECAPSPDIEIKAADGEALELVPLVDPKEIQKKTLANALQEKIPDKSLHKTIDKLVKLMGKDDQLSRFLKEENLAGATELILYLLENKKETMLDLIKKKNIIDLKFEFMFNLSNAFRELCKKIFYVSPGSGTTLAEVEEIEQEYHELKQLYHDYQKMAKNLGDPLSPVDFDGESMETIMQKQEKKFAWVKPHRIATGKLKEIKELKDNEKMISALLSELDLILGNILKIKDDSVRGSLERKLYWFVNDIEVTAENVGTAKKVLEKLSDPLFEKVRELLEKKINEAGTSKAPAAPKLKSAFGLLGKCREDKPCTARELDGLIHIGKLSDKEKITTLRTLARTAPENAVIIITGTSCPHCREAIKNGDFSHFALSNSHLDVYWHDMRQFPGSLKVFHPAEIQIKDLFQLVYWPTIITFANKEIRYWNLENNELIAENWPEAERYRQERYGK